MKPKRFLWAMVGALTGCGPGVQRQTMLTSDVSDYPCTLHDPETIKHDFMVRQTLTIDTKHEGKPVNFSFDAVVQKQGNTLLIIGFGPMRVKAFTLTQKGSHIDFAQFMGPPVPFSPRNILVDVHRVFFKRLPADPDPKFSGVKHAALDDEMVEETWRDGQLTQAVFTRPGSKWNGAIRIELGPGCTAKLCEPETATLHNEWFGYKLTIANDSYEEL